MTNRGDIAEVSSGHCGKDTASAGPERAVVRCGRQGLSLSQGARAAEEDFGTGEGVDEESEDHMVWRLSSVRTSLHTA